MGGTTDVLGADVELMHGRFWLNLGGTLRQTERSLSAIDSTLMVAASR